MAETFLPLSASWDSICLQINFSLCPQGTFHFSFPYSYNLPTMLGERMEIEGWVLEWLLRISHEALPCFARSIKTAAPLLVLAQLYMEPSGPEIHFPSRLPRKFMSNKFTMPWFAFFFFFVFPLYLKILLSIEHYTTVALLWFLPHEWEIYNSASIYFDSFWDIKKITEQHLFSDMLQPMIIFFHCTSLTVLLLH